MTDFRTELFEIKTCLVKLTAAIDLECVVINEVATAPKPIEIQRRKDPEPFNGFYMGSAENLIKLMKTIYNQI